MPPCVCGLKVDRHEDKLICIICKQIFHPECCNYKKADYLYIKNSYKCKKCLSLRRSSLSSLPVDVTDIGLVSDVTHENAAVVVAEKPVFVNVNTDSCDITHENADVVVAKNPFSAKVNTDSYDTDVVGAEKLINVSMHMDDVVANNVNITDDCEVVAAAVIAQSSNFDIMDFAPNASCANNNADAAVTTNPNNLLSKNVSTNGQAVACVGECSVNLKIDLLTKEVAALRKSNAELVSLVSMLHKNNANINSKFDDLLLTVKDLHKIVAGLPNDRSFVSPKRKKQIPSDRSKGSCKSINNGAVGDLSASTLSDVCLSSDSIVGVDSTMPRYNSIVESGVSTNVEDTAMSVRDKPSFAEIARSVNLKPQADSKKKVLPVVVGSMANTERTSEKSNDFILVNNNKNSIKKHKSQKIVVGNNSTDELSVFTRMKWVHLSSFSNTVSSEDIVNYLVKHTNFKANQFVCYKLIKKDTDVSKLKFVNFKLGTELSCYKTLFDSSLWPANIKVRPFDFLEKEVKPSLVI